MDIGSVLSRAFEIMRKHKVLWIFGILAGCSSANSGSGGSNNFRTRYENGEVPPQMQQFFDQFANIPSWQIAVFVAVVIAVILLLVVVAIFLGTMGRVGLIRGTLQAEGGAGHLEFSELFSGGMRYFWRVFGLNLLAGLAMIVVVFILIALAIPLALTIVGLACLIPLFCLLAPLGWFVQLVVEQGSIAIVVEDLGLMAGLQRGWEVVKNNLGNVIVMWLILGLGVGLIGGFIIGFPVFLFVLPAILGAMAGTQAAIGGSLLVTGLCLVAYLPVLIFLNGLLTGYIETAWTLTFLRLTGRSSLPAVPVEPAPLA
jgi:hypothetical protein